MNSIEGSLSFRKAKLDGRALYSHGKRKVKAKCKLWFLAILILAALLCGCSEKEEISGEDNLTETLEENLIETPQETETPQIPSESAKTNSSQNQSDTENNTENQVIEIPLKKPPFLEGGEGE